MKDEELNLDTAAEKLYGAPYSYLSAWGQQHVRHVLGQMNRVHAPHTAALPSEASDEFGLRLANEKLRQELEQSRLEAADLWQENADLQEELAKLRSQWNPPSDS